MIRADLHTHTTYSHAADQAERMVEAARNKGLSVFGISEHSPRPEGYLYPSDYQEKLQAKYPDYIREIQELRNANTPDFTVLLGLEADFMPDKPDFSKKSGAAADFDYIIGGLHFQGTWGFDCCQSDWDALRTEDKYNCYTKYYHDLAYMITSGIIDIVAHPDLIKIFSVEVFRAWLRLPSSKKLLHSTLGLIRECNLLMEVSSAGLRKPCGEIYPGPEIMRLAADLDLKICLSSDAHSADQIAYAFDELEKYAKSYGYTESYIVQGSKQHPLGF